MTRFLFLAVMFHFSLYAQTTTTKTQTPYLVLQLFTSQGCSSCPPADALLEEIKKETQDKNISILSYHVDYWNYIGWNDPFSSKEFTKIQYAYGKKFRKNRVYTPQLVVNGNEHFVGSNQARVQRILRGYTSNIASNTISLPEVQKTKHTIKVNYAVTGNIENKNIVFALVLERKSTLVKSGENRNREITNSNIVLNQLTTPLSSSPGNISIEIPKKFNNETRLRLIAFVQKNNLEITGTIQQEL
ncbi:conserved exported protein of unknown function [Tenacibaculum sp. 190130A14a]|uniref:DUF1223 domain-containing protein n=1 Tax=Tenacibaculum polynesiense TaxID=3137857 RepID=A0ABP1F108_9FLAO